MGYYRPKSAFNTGKQGEYEERVCFAEPADI
jgi:ribonucleoside-triphosphate reductase